MDSAAVSIKCEEPPPSQPSPPPPGAADDDDSDGGGKRGVGRLVDSTQADDLRMIWLVRDRPLLYARSNLPVASYHAEVKKLWRQVADIMGWTVAEVRRKWSHVRNSYSRHLRNELHGVRTGRGRRVSRWYLADQLEFLRAHMATDTRPCPLSLVPPAPRPLQPAPTAGGDAEESSAYFQFFRGLYRDYRELPPRRQRRFRRQCLLSLHRLLDGEEPHPRRDSDDAEMAPPSPPPPPPPPLPPPSPPPQKTLRQPKPGTKRARLLLHQRPPHASHE